MAPLAKKVPDPCASQNKSNGNFNDASLERLHSVSGPGINGVLTPSDAFDLESPLN